MPDVEEWKKMSVEEKSKILYRAYDKMLVDIMRLGDWRGRESPFNVLFYSGKCPIGGLVKASDIILNY